MARNHDLRLSNDKFAGIFNPYDYDPPELAPMPPYCAECGDRRGGSKGETLCDRCKGERR